MFYSQFILAKKGPLGTIWIAAHLERKLRKNQVADTDIGLSVDSILFPEVPIALRLSSHLLLGVVRIYSRKVNYLFHDCSEALLKVKQAFRSTAVDLPPEESTAPYHSITLPETFHLDDFELPDSAFQGDFVDHHVSTKEQITLQDTMDGTGFSMQFGLDERFGDGNASQIGLDLDEDIFLDKHHSGQHVSLTPGLDECIGHQGQSSSSVFATEMEIDNKDMDPELSKDFPALSNDCDRQSEVHQKKDDLSSHCQGYNVQTPDLNEVFSPNDNVEEPPPDLIDCAHAPSTPGLVEETFTANAHESPALSPQQKLSPSIGEAADKLDNSRSEFECPDLATDNGHERGMGMDSDSVNAVQVMSSPTSALLEQAEQTTAPDETRIECGGQNDIDNAKNVFVSSETKELPVDDQGHDLGGTILHDEGQLEDLKFSRSHDASVSRVPVDGLLVDSGVILAAPKSSSDNLLASEAASVANDSLLGDDAQPLSCSNLEHLQDANPGPNTSSFPLRSCTSQENLADELSAEDGALVQTAIEVHVDEQGVQVQELAREKMLQDKEISLGKDCLIGIATDADLEVHEKSGEALTEPIQDVSNANEPLAGPLQKDTQLDQLNCSSSSEFLEPEKMLLAPQGEQDLANELSQVISEKGVIESDGSVNRIASLSGKKRRLEESASTIPNASSVKLSVRPRLRSNSEHIPDDDDLLASILVGKRTPLLKVGSTPPPPKEASLKRPRMTSRLGMAKRKVLLDDTTVLHADAIRQQLINTEDIRRIRKKAPCTRPEIWMIQKSSLEDEIFDEPVLTGISGKLTSLHKVIYYCEDNQHNLYLNPSNEYDLSRSSELEANENEKDRPVSAMQANVDGAIEEPCGASVSNEARSDKDTDELDQNEHLQLRSNLTQLDPLNNVGSSSILTKDLNEQEKDAGFGLPIPSAFHSPRLECETSSAHLLTDDISLHNSNISTSLPEHSDELGIHVQQSVECLAQTENETFAVNDALSHLPKNACAEELDVAIDPKSMMVDNDAQVVVDKVIVMAVEGSYDATDSSIMAKGKMMNSVLDSSLHEVEAVNVTNSSTVICHASSPLQSMFMQNDESADLAVLNDHQVMNKGETFLGAEVDDGTVNQKVLHDEESTVPDEARPEQASICPSQPNGENGNAPSAVGENSDLQIPHLEGDMVVESTPMDLTTAKESSDFCSAVDGNDTEFLNVDDEADYEEADNDVPNAQDAQSLENSGWSSRTRGVARYLKTLFDEESGLGRKAVAMDHLIAGKTRKEASRMFFETLVLKTKDYIHVEQENPFEFIAIKPRAKLLKSEF